ncbi:MAG: HEAT repeat domain-containing protein [Anaerolineales bacterium]|nr:HEAT repeat domain-containing protein [Anaerolineales bacterium]
MDANKLQTLIQQPEPENLKLDFKQKFYEVYHSDPKVQKMHWCELIKDILALANGNVGMANQEGYLVIGVSDARNAYGTRDLYDVGDIGVTTQQILSKVNSACTPKLPDLHGEIIEVEGKRIYVLIIPPTPYLHETTQPIVTPKTTYHENTVFIRHKEAIAVASTDERLAIREDKKANFPLPVEERFGSTSPTLTDDLINEHRRRLAKKPRYAKWADRSSDESYISSTGFHLPVFASPYESSHRKPELLIRSIRSHQRLLILGEPGMGKTVTLERVMWEFSSDDVETVPVYVPLIQYRNNLASDIISALNETSVLNIANPASLESVLQDHRCILLFDGLNEVAGDSQDSLYLELAAFLRKYTSCSCVITSRSQDNLWQRFHSPEMIENAVVIDRISDDHIVEYLKAHLGEREGQELYDRLNEALRGLARVPLFLWLIKEVGQAGEELPGNRGALFDRFVKRALTREQKQPDLTIVPRSKKIQALSYLAFHLQSDRRLSCSRDEAIKIVKDSYKDVEAVLVINEALQNGLLMGGEQVNFMHQALFEYFVAVRVQELVNSSSLTLKKRLRGWAKDDRWAEVFVQLAGITSDPMFLAKQVLISNPWLAYWCSIEGTPLDQLLQNRIESQTVRKLDSSKSEERLRVVRELARMENPRTIEFLILALSDSTVAVTEMAQRTLIELGEPAVNPLLDSLAVSSENLRQIVTRILGEIWQIPSLVKLGAGDVHIRCEAAKILGHIRDERALVPLFAALADSNIDVRLEVAQSLGRLGDSRAIAPLMQALERSYAQDHSDESSVIAQALSSLGESTDQSLLNGLKEFDDATRMQALVALGSTWNRPEISELADPNPHTRASAIKKLQQSLDTGHIEPILLAALKDQDRLVRWEAIISLGQIESNPVIVELADENPHTRETAIRRLEGTSSSLSIELLIAMFRDPDPGVRTCAAKAFENQKTSAIEYLVPLLYQTDRELRQIAGLALSNMDYSEVVDALITAIQDPRWSVREAIVDPLVKMGDRAVDALETLLSVDDIEVRKLVRVILGRIGTVKAYGALRLKGTDHLRPTIMYRLRRVFLLDAEMDDALYERELAEGIDCWRNELKQKQDDMLFVIVIDSDGTAMLLLTRKGETYKNEAAREKLRKIWAEVYETRIKSLIPSMARKLANGIPTVHSMKM